MCTRPITILNPKISHQTDFNPRCDKEFITVPCNDCPDCIGQRHNEWLSRAWYEYKNCVSLGGKVCFLTFTYNDFYLPYFMDVPCFDKTDITKFFKNFRKQLKILTGHKVPFRYFITTEYGKEQCRPHYHVLFYFYENIPDYDIFKLAWCSWSPYPSMCLPIFEEYSNDISKYVGVDEETGEIIPIQRGIVQIGKNRDGVQSLTVNDISGIYYCTKYILKDSAWFTMRNRLFCKYVKSRFPAALDEELILNSDYVKNNPCLYLLQKEFLSEIKNFDLFHRQSIGFGSCILDLCSEAFKTEKISVPDPHDLSKYREMPIPLYIQRKLFYDCKSKVKGLTLKLSKRGNNYSLRVLKETTSSFILSEKGALHRFDTFEKMIDKKFVNYYKLRNLHPNDEFMSLYFPNKSIDDVWNEFDTIINNRPLRRLFEYQLVFKDRNIVDFGFYIKQSNLDFIKKSTIYFAREYYLNFIHPHYKLIPFKVSSLKYNDHVLFKDFDLALNILSKFKKLESYQFHFKNIELYNKRQNVDVEFGKYRSARLKPLPNILNF